MGSIKSKNSPLPIIDFKVSAKHHLLVFLIEHLLAFHIGRLLIGFLIGHLLVFLPATVHREANFRAQS